MSKDAKLSENPILAWLKRSKTVAWSLAFLALVGGAINYGSDVIEKSKKLIEWWHPDPAMDEKRADLRFQAEKLGFNIAVLAFLPPNAAEVASYTHVANNFDPSILGSYRSSAFTVIDTLVLPASLKELNYEEQSFGELPPAVRDLAQAITSTKGPQVAKQFLHSYWSFRILFDQVYPHIGSGQRWVTLIPRLNESAPSDIEPFRPVEYSHFEYCKYFTRYAPIDLIAPFYGKREGLMAMCDEVKAKIK